MPVKPRNVNLSYWELKQFFSHYDLVVVGSGIVGIFTALAYRKENKNARILILERGVLPYGASTKNAGFACFGSISELSADLLTIKPEKVWETVAMRWHGLKLLRNTLSDKKLDYQGFGGYELFNTKDEFEKNADEINLMNMRVSAITGKKNCYSANKTDAKLFGFKKVYGLIYNKLEGQIDTGKMMFNLMKLARKHEIEFLNGINVLDIEDNGKTVCVKTNTCDFSADKVVVATNGFAKQLLPIKDVEPARAQVLITKPIKNLKIKGTFHYQQGYYYFRNIDNRLLFGGARNIDLKRENTAEFATTEKIQNRLEFLLKEMILPSTKFEIDHRWVGIMGVGNEKKPIIKKISNNVVVAVRMGGMGVAIGSLVGKQAVEELK